MHTMRKMSLCRLHGKHVVQVAAHRGVELFMRLAAEGIETTVVRNSGSLLASLEMDDDVNLDSVRAVLNQWEG
jgi:hypothetical protein